MITVEELRASNDVVLLAEAEANVESAKANVAIAKLELARAEATALLRRHRHETNGPYKAPWDYVGGHWIETPPKQGEG